MIRHLIKHGDNYALMIDPATMALMQLTADSQLEVSILGQTLTLTPVGVADTTRRAELATILREVNADYSPALRKLAE